MAQIVREKHAVDKVAVGIGTRLYMLEPRFGEVHVVVLRMQLEVASAEVVEDLVRSQLGEV